MATPESAVLKDPPQVRGIPLIGNTLAMAKDPARFFVDCYRRYGPVFRVRIMNHMYTVLAGAEAANFMGTRAGRDSLRSKEFWQGLVGECAGAMIAIPRVGDHRIEHATIIQARTEDREFDEHAPAVQTWSHMYVHVVQVLDGVTHRRSQGMPPSQRMMDPLV